MSFVDGLLKRPHLVIVFAFATVFIGWLAFKSLPLNLFPDTNRPTVNVITQWPGAAADDVATDLTHPLEVRLSGIDGVQRVTSTSRDEVSAVSVEFEYGVDIDTAATDVSNELPRVRGLLPEGTRDPLIFKITEAARPVVVLALRPAKGVNIDLGEVRRLAENQFRDALLRISDVAEAEVFGGHERELSIALDRDRLEAHRLTIGAVASILAGSNVSIPSGLIHNRGRRYLLFTQTLAHLPADVEEILVPLSNGTHVRIGDLGKVRWGESDTMSLYRGNGREAIAVSLLRGEKGFADKVLREVEKALPGIKRQFPMLDIQIADTQGRLIDLTVSNMLGSLRDAVIMTLIVILLFLANTRAALITAISLPLSYLLTFVVMKLLGYEFNMVTLTAVIIAVGLLADDAVVVIENIERRIREKNEKGMKAAARGTREILLADASGTISTVIVLVPIMFIGGYVQNVLRPLTVTLSVALLASLIVSVTLIPLLASRVLKPKAKEPLQWVLRPFTKFFLEPVKGFYVSAVRWALRRKGPVLLAFFLLFAFSARQMPFLGRELMPLMDTGVFQVSFEAEPETDDPGMKALLERVEAAIRDEVLPEWLISTSSVVGSEPGVKSFGAARSLQQGEITVNLVDRFHRDRTIYQIEDGIRKRIRRIPGLISGNVYEFGATPLSSIRGTVDVMISGPDGRVLDALGNEVMQRLAGVRGLTGIQRTWQGGAKRIKLEVNQARARLYDMDAREVARQTAQMVGGASGGRLRVKGQNPIPILVRMKPEDRADRESILALPISLPDRSQVPLEALSTLKTVTAPTAETHQALLPTIDILGYRRNIAVTHLQEKVEAALADLPLPRGYQFSQEGTIKEMNDAFGRLGKSLALGLILLYLMLVVTFRSFLDPLAIMGTLPLALIGAVWAMMLAGKHGCLPSFMGLILLMGIVVNNGILLVDFAKTALQEGENLTDALTEAVKLRTRPILMTAGASAVGMLPIALEWAVGIERLSPLAVVAIGGLIAGTFLTLLIVPLLFFLIETMRRRFYRKH